MEKIPQTLEELTQLVEEKRQKQSTSVWGYLMGSLVLPPFSLIYVLTAAYRKNVLHLVLPAITILYSILALLNGLLTLSAAKYTALIPGVVGGGKQNNSFLYLTLGLAVIGAGLGFYFRNKCKRDGVLETNGLLIMIAVLVMQFVLMIVALFSAISGISAQFSDFTSY